MSDKKYRGRGRWGGIGALRLGSVVVAGCVGTLGKGQTGSWHLRFVM